MNPTNQMPRYRCHKEVRALKIASVWPPEGSVMGEIIPVEDGFGVIMIDQDFFQKHSPQAGGYYVVYADGYCSFSPAQAFEEGYTRV